MNDFESMTGTEAEAYVGHLRETFTVARILDAGTLGDICVGDGKTHTPIPGEKFWETHSACERCAACQALAEKTQKTKLEFVGNEIWQVWARYVEVDGKPFVLELIDRLDDDCIADFDGKSRLLTKLSGRYEELYRDVLTGTYNRRFYEERMRHEAAVAGVAMMDIDDFKLYNDIYGHGAGDAVLAAVTAEMKKGIRKTDKLVRFGGDEFLLVMPGVPDELFYDALRDICRRVNGLQVKDYGGLRLSVSIGGTMCHDELVEEAVARADKLMYRAKQRKNTLVTDRDTAPVSDENEKQLILIVDDAEINREILARILHDDFRIMTATGGEECISTLEKYGTAVAIVLLDIIMPGTDGFDVLEYMSERRLLDDIPVVAITGDTSDVSVKRAYEMGVTDHISRPFDARIVRRRVNNTVRLYAKQRRLISLITTEVTERDRNGNFLFGLMAQLESHRCGTVGAPVFRIREITRLLLEQLAKEGDMYRFDSRDVSLICKASMMHDIGEVGIKRKILRKPGALSAEEYEEVKKHPLIAADMIERLPEFRDEPLFRWVYQICRWHHERYDGGGYPDGLRGDEIPFAAQVVSIADTFDALTSDRPYRKAMTPEIAMRMIRDGACGAFSPMLVGALGAVYRQIPDAALWKTFSSVDAGAGDVG